MPLILWRFHELQGRRRQPVAWEAQLHDVGGDELTRRVRLEVEGVGREVMGGAGTTVVVLVVVVADLRLKVQR